MTTSENDDRLEAACEGAYEALAALWHGAIKGWYPERTPELLYEAHERIMQAISLAEDQGIISVDRDGGTITGIEAYPRAALERAAGEQGSTRDQLEQFLTDESRRKVEEFMAETAGESDDFDIDEVIAQNHRDAMRDWGLIDE